MRTRSPRGCWRTSSARARSASPTASRGRRCRPSSVASWRSADEASQALEVEDADASVVDLHEPRLAQPLQRLVHALARDAAEVTQLFLRELQLGGLVGVEQRVEESGERARHARVGLEQPLVLDHRDELRETLVQLQEEEAVEADVRVEQ